jgi:hypothetical protein
LEKIATCAILKDDPQVISRFVPVEEAEDMTVFEIVENSNLIQHLLAAILLH